MKMTSLACLRDANICTENGYESVPQPTHEPENRSADLIADFHLITRLPERRREFNIFDMFLLTGCTPTHDQEMPVEECYIDESLNPNNGSNYPRACAGDEDQDGVINADDICPFDEGSVENLGCPPGDCRNYVPQDADGDGFDNASDCGGNDCNDHDALINPSASEITGNGIDENCNGMGDADEDGDGIAVNAGDCNDQDASIHPGAADPQDDGVDSACDGNGSGVACGDSEFTTIQGFINAIPSGVSDQTEVFICGSGLNTESVNTLGKDLSLRGDNLIHMRSSTDGERSLTITGGRVDVDNIDFDGGRSSADGGAVLIENGTVSFTNCYFSNNEAVNGGAIALHGGSARFDVVYITSNRASMFGGAIYARNADVSFEPKYVGMEGRLYSNVSSNSAAEQGGAIFIREGRLTLNNQDPLYLQQNDAPRGSTLFCSFMGVAEINDVPSMTMGFGQTNALVELGNPGSSLVISGTTTMTSENNLPNIWINGVNEGYNLRDLGGDASCSYDIGTCE